MPGVLEELGELKPRLKNRNTLAYLLMLEGMIAMSRSDLEHSVTLHEQSLQCFARYKIAGNNHVPGPPWSPGIDPGRLRERPYTAAGKLRLAWELDYKQSIQHCLYTLACVTACREQPVAPLGCWGRGRHGGGLWCAPHPRDPLPHQLRGPHEQGALAAGRGGVRGGVGGGKAMSLEQAVIPLWMK